MRARKALRLIVAKDEIENWRIPGYGCRNRIGEIGRDRTLLGSGISRCKSFDRRNLLSRFDPAKLFTNILFKAFCGIEVFNLGFEARIVIGDDRLFSFELLLGTHFLIVVRDWLIEHDRREHEGCTSDERLRREPRRARIEESEQRNEPCEESTFLLG